MPNLVALRQTVRMSVRGSPKIYGTLVGPDPLGCGVSDPKKLAPSHVRYRAELGGQTVGA